MSSPTSQFDSSQATMMRILRDMGLSDTQEVANTELWLTWIFEAQKEMRLQVQTTSMGLRIPIEDCAVQKPFGYISANSIRIVDSNGLGVTPQFRKTGDFANLAYAYAAGFDSDYSIESQPFIFSVSSNANGMQLELEYKSIYLGDDLTPVVDTNYYTAILAYCVYKWKCRSRAQGERTFSAGDEQQAKTDWIRAYRRNRMNDTMDRLTGEVISQLMSAYNDPFFMSESIEARKTRIRNLQMQYRGQPYMGLIGRAAGNLGDRIY